MTAVHISKHSPFHHVEALSRSRSVVDCAQIQAFVCVVCDMCGVRVVYVSCRVLCVCCNACACALSVCVWDVRLVFWCCGVLLCVLCMSGCVLGCGCGCGCVCGVWCVWRDLERGKKTVCRFKNVSLCRSKTLPCVPAKRAHVQISLFFPSPAEKFVLFFPLWGSSR